MKEGALEELREFIEQIHNEDYNLFSNNCLTKSNKIYDKAKKLGIEVRLVGCVSLSPGSPVGPGGKHMPPYLSPHAYLMVEDERVDVFFSPEQEKKYWPNGVKVFFSKTLKEEKGAPCVYNVPKIE